MEEIAKHDPLIKKRMSAYGNSKYTSSGIQNEILECFAEMVQTEIIKEVKVSEVFSVIADETKDLGKKEQVSLVLRYYYNGTVHESFLNFQQAESLDAAGLSSMIIKCLEKYGLEYRTNLVGQGYDGAAVMSGRHSGVSKRIQDEAKYAFYVHCTAHCLNLVLVDSVKSVPEADTFFAVLQRLYTFISGSYVHKRWLEIQQDMYSGQPRKLQKLSDTRWACRYSACRNLTDRLPAVFCILQEIVCDSSGDRSVEARGLLAQLDLTFIGLLATFNTILGQSKILSDMLQSPSVDLATAVNLVEALLDTLQQYRDYHFFEDMWKEVEEMAVKCQVSLEKTEKRPQILSSRLCGSVITSSTGARRDNLGKKEAFKRHILYPVIDSFMSELQRRFSKRNCEIMQGIQALHPKSSTFLHEEPLFSFAEIFESNIEDLKHELYQTKRVLETKEKKKDFSH